MGELELDPLPLLDVDPWFPPEPEPELLVLPAPLLPPELGGGAPDPVPLVVLLGAVAEEELELPPALLLPELEPEVGAVLAPVPESGGGVPGVGWTDS